MRAIRYRGVVKRKEKLIAIGVGDLNYVITPPRFLTRNRAHQDLAAKLIDPIQSELHEEAALVLALRIFTENDLALPRSTWQTVPLPSSACHFFLKPSLST